MIYIGNTQQAQKLSLMQGVVSNYKTHKPAHTLISKFWIQQLDFENLIVFI